MDDLSNVDFDPNLNVDYHEKYNNQSSIAQAMVGGPVAAATDFAASVWNSLPFTPEVKTSELLSKISTDALEVYNAHPDAVEAASFIGGMLAPSALAMKSMQAARAGVKGANWFSKAGKVEDLARIDSLFQEGAGATAQYRRARTEFFAKGLANQALDAVAMEAAIVGTMNAHPLMEDYMADPVKNFAIGAAFGGVLGGTIGHIVDRFEVGKLVGAAESKAYQTVLEEFQTARAANQNATKLQIHQANIDGLKKIVEGDYNDLTKEIADRVMKSSQMSQLKTFEEMLSPEVMAFPKEVRDELMARFSSDPATKGVDGVALLTQKMEGAGNVLNMKGGTLYAQPTFAKIETKDVAGNVLDTKLAEVSFFPEFGRYATPADAKHYARARDLGKSIEQMDKELGKDFGRIPNKDIAEEALAANSATVDARYLAALHRVDKMDPKEIQKLVISPDDLPLMNAVLARIGREPDAFTGMKIKMTNNHPNFEAFNQQIIVGQANKGVKPTHLQDNLKFTTPDAMRRYDLLDPMNLNTGASTNIMDTWVSGNKDPLINAIEEFRLGKDTAFAKLGEEVYNSEASKALRAKFMENADNEGYVYLYRGMKSGKATGHGSLDSYTTDPEKALEFTGRSGSGPNGRDPSKVRMYRVKVDDIIGGVLDIPETGHTGRKNEIIVRAATLDSPATLPVASPGAATTVSTKTATGVDELDHMALSQHFLDKKDELVSSLLNQGIPPEAIAIRTNTPLDTILKFAASTEGTSLVEVGTVSEYRNIAELESYMDPSKRALKLSSSAQKLSFSDLKAGLDIKTAADIDHEIKSVFYAQSDSVVVRDLGSLIFGQNKAALDILRAQISNFVNAKAGNKFLTSFDAYAKNMEEAGMIASMMGKDMQHVSNNAETLILKPIRERMARVVTDPVSLVEINTARELNASLKGYRIYKDRQFWQLEKALDETGKEIERLAPATFQGNQFRVATDSVDALLHEMQTQGREMYNMQGTIRQTLGQKPMSDIGFWIPSMNPVGKHISYILDVDGGAKMLWGNTAEELMTAEKAYKATLTPEQLQNVKFIGPKGDQTIYNALHGRNDAVSMEVANVGMQKTGSTSSAIVKANADILSELAAGYQHNINSNIRQLADIAMADITDVLNRMSEVNKQYFKDQPLGVVGKLLHRPKDTAAVVRNTLLGNSNLSEYANWAEVNKGFETVLAVATRTVGDLWKGATDPLRKGFLGGKKDLTTEAMAKMDYETFAKKLEEQGVYNPWKAFDDEAANIFGVAKLAEHKDSSARIIYASNAFAATVALRVGEIAQPLVNAMSLPILTSLAISNKMPETFMGIQKATAKVGTTQIMYEGMRASHDPVWTGLGKKWEKLGYFSPMVSEVNETLALSRTFDKSPMATIEKALDSNFVKVMSKPADFSEALVRRQTMFTGAVLAKRLYPELDDMGVTIFARDFMDRAVGNYHAAQRPVFFQGTAGVALGLFQTYMVTMAQNMYRAIELKNFKGLAKTMLAQNTIFGASSLPGFNAISEAIGEHFSENHYDLTTGTYRAVGDKMANFLLYGMPSNMTGGALYTRGDTNPRFPNLLGSGVKDVVGVNFAIQTVDSLNHVVDAVKAQRPDIGQALGEALSMQSMSRPVARLSELATGYSVTRKGNTVQTPAEVWTATGIISRLLSTRPLEEAKLRQADHLNTFYGAQDRDARNKLMMEIKTALRNGTVDGDLVSRVSEEYMRKGGSPTGWRSAYRTAIAQSNVNGKAPLMDKLDEDSPLLYMIDNLD